MSNTDFAENLTKTTEIDLSVTGRISGRESSRPVWFVQEAKQLYLLPVTGSDSQWYKNVVKTPTLKLSAEGADYVATAKTITDPKQVGHVVDEFRAKYGADDVRSYYTHPTVAVLVPLA